MGNAYKESHEFDKAIAAYKKALFLWPESSEVFNNMGNVFGACGKIDKAIATYKKALSFNPQNAHVYINLGQALQEKGKIKEAVESYKTALSIEPENYIAHRALSLIINFKGHEKQFSQLPRLIESKRISDDARCHLSFALAKMYDDIKNYSRAFEYLAKGNGLREKLLHYSIDLDVKLFENLKKAQPEIFKNSLKKNINGSVPIFILGMP